MWFDWKKNAVYQVLSLDHVRVQLLASSRALLTLIRWLPLWTRVRPAISSPSAPVTASSSSSIFSMRHCRHVPQFPPRAATRVTVAQDHVAPLGCQECVAFSPDASMLSCVSNSEVNRSLHADVCRTLLSPSFCRFGPGTCAARHRLCHLLGVLCVVLFQNFCAVLFVRSPAHPSAFRRVMLIGSGTLLHCPAGELARIYI
jgi:hypothetical protein